MLAAKDSSVCPAKEPAKDSQGLGPSLRRISRRPKPKWEKRPEILLHPNIPKPLHGLTPRGILGAKWWNKTRQKAYQSTNFHCQACGVAKHESRGPGWLEGHEMYDVDNLLGTAAYIETVPLCAFCHNYIHSGRLLMLLEEGQITQQRYIEVIQHGDDALRQAGLGQAKQQVYDGPMADWADWRLLLNGKEYKPKFGSLREWQEAFGRKEDE